MPYVVTRLKPRSREIKIEDLLMNVVTEQMMRPVTNAEATGTRTYYYKNISPEKLELLNIPEQIKALDIFYFNNKYLLEELEDPLYNHKLQAELIKVYGSHNMEKIKEEVAKRGFKYSDIYTTFYRPKKSSKPGKTKWRQIDAPREDLMTALSTLKNMFEIMMDGCFYHSAAFAYIPKRRTVDLGIKHQNNKSNWFLKMDFSNFFGSTTPDFIMRMLSIIYPFSEIVKFPKGKETLEKCLRFCVLDGGLPQGTPMSPILTNIIMIPIDHKLSNALHNKKEISSKGYEYSYIYTRYADDIYISNRINFNYKNIEAYVNKVLDYFDAPFRLNEEKTRYGSKAGANWILGYMLNQDNDITVGHRRKKALKGALTNYMLDRENGHSWSSEDLFALNGEISYCESIEKENINLILDKLSIKYGDIRQAIKADLRSA